MNNFTINCKRNLTAKIVLFIIEDYIFEIIKTFYYVTDTTDYRQKTFFYRKIIWHRIAKIGLESYMKRNVYRCMKADEVRKFIEQRLPISTLRLIVYFKYEF